MNLVEQLKRGSSEYQYKMKSNHQPDVYIITGVITQISGESANPKRNGEYAPSVASKMQQVEKSDELKSSMSATELGPQIKEASPRREHDDI